MNAIRKFEISGMTLSGFKCFANTTELTFGNPTLIFGGNGRGKSSVADAIAFAVTGLPFFGERGIDRLHAEQNNDLFISMRFTDENGAEHELTRTRQKTRMTITLDGREIRQVDLTDLFGEKDVFLSIFNPLYFIEELGDDGKKLLERYLPEITQEEVLAQLSESAQETLRGEKILSPESFLKKKREDIRELEKSKIYLSGQKDLSESQCRQAEEKRSALEETLRKLETECAELESRRYAGMDVADVQERLVELSARYEELAKEAPASADTSEIDKELAELNRKLGERSAEQYAPKYAQPIAELTAKVKELGGRYQREAATLKGFTAGTVCPTCRRAVTEAELPAVRDSLQKAVAEIIAPGKDAKGQLDELTALEQKTADTFRQFQQDDVQKLNAEIHALTEKRSGLSEQAAADNAARQAELDSLLGQIRSLSADADCGVLSPEDYERLLACRTEIESCRSELAAVQRITEATPEDYDGKISGIDRQIEDLKKLIADVALYVSKRAEMLFSSLKMNRVQISLFDVVKSTGEIKDAFQFTYIGRRYDRLSLSEKVRAGIEVSELMKRLTGRNYPQYVDNMESIDDLANVRPTGQVIMAKCVKGAELSVRVPGGTETMPKAA